MKAWYVEVTRQDIRYGYVSAETRDEAIEKVTAVGSDDVDGLTTTIGSWEVVAAHEFESLGHHDDNEVDSIKILR